MRSGNGTVVCENMILNKLGLEEMVGRGSLHAGNFIEVNYDRWMKDTWATIARLYHFLGVQLTPDTVQEIQVAYGSTVTDKLLWFPCRNISMMKARG